MPPTIGFLTSDLTHGHGWGHYSLSLMFALQRLGIPVRVIASRNTDLDYPLEIAPLLPNVYPADSAQLLRFAAGLGRFRRAVTDCDLLHVTAEPFAPLAMGLGKPYIVTGHGSYAQPGIARSQWVRPLHRAAFARAHTVVCVSEYTQKRALAVAPEITTTVVQNGVDPSRFASLPIPSSPVTRPTVLAVGGVKKRKGTLQLVRAMAAVRERVPQAQLIVVGSTATEPDTTTAVIAAIDELNLHQHVHLTGFIDEHELMTWYSAAHVFALPSINDGWKFEGFGLVHLEASAAGLPVIGTRDCGAEAAILHGETGLLVSQSEDGLRHDLPAAIIDLLTNPQRARQMGEAGRAHARTQTWDTVAARMLEIYEAAL